ncbi:prolyl oligopeptidase family serine peptidase [Arcanobacterium haemolyticum]|nr:prolyl oligopeptidase family serine peptidase [Arcanobacterium haemolyticum]
MTIVHRADLVKDSSNAGIIYGYGSYEISNDPWFSPTILSALERGVVYAVAHVRGGGEMGRAWYDDGKMLSKRNTFTDFVACARWMAESGLVDAGRLAAEGGSAGGLLMGAVANLAPDAFRVVHAIVPFVDALNTILKPELPLTVGEWEEWGNPIESEEVYRYMKSYTPYENVAAVEYPAIMASTSLNDIRVSYIEPTKWIQALRDTVTNDEIARPIIQRTEMVAGHGGGSGRYKKWEERAAQLAFIFDQIGVK